MNRLSLAMALIMCGCAGHRVHPGQDNESSGASNSSPSQGRGKITDSDVHAEVDAMFASGELRPVPRSLRQGRPLEAAKASAYTNAPANSRYASSFPMAAPPAGDPPSVEFYVFSVGQADSMLVVGPPPSRKTLLIDAGETNWNTRRGCVTVRDRIKAITGKHHVDYFVLSHYHMDHAGNPPTMTQSGKVFEGGGLFCLLGSTPQFFTIGTLIDSGPAADPFQPNPKRILEAIVASEPDWISAGTLGTRELARFGTSQIDLGAGVEIEIIATDGKAHTNDPGVHVAVETATPGTYQSNRQASPNDFSIGMEITVGNFELFTAGDLTGAAGEPPYPASSESTHGDNTQIYTNIESPLAAYWTAEGRESNVEVYRANHHGSGNSSTVDLLSLLLPEVVIYSCGGQHGHPDESIVERVYSLGADQLITTKADRLPGVEFDEMYGRGWDNPVGEIKIVVPVQGNEFTISSATQAWSYPIMSDSDE